MHKTFTNIIFSILLLILPLPILGKGCPEGGNGASMAEIGATGALGFIMNDGKVEDVAPDRMPAVGADLSVSFRPDWAALRQWNDASVGAGLSYWYLGDRKLGHAVAPYAFVDIPLVRLKHFELGLRPAVGFALVTKTFYNTLPAPMDNFDNFALKGSGTTYTVGSVFNLYLPETFYMNFPIRNGWAITLAGGWYHMSNGSIRQPNSGYNIFGGELGVRYDMSEDKKLGRDLYWPEDERPKKWEVELGWTGGGRQVYYKDRQSFFCSTISLSAYWRAHNIFRLGGGVDVFYDGAYTERETKFGKTDLTGATQADCWRLGVSLQPEFVIGHFTAGFHAGVYLLDPVKKMEGNADKGVFYKYDLLNAGSAGHPDGWLYTQIVLRYRLPWHIFIEGQMKAHLTKVEFISAGLGVYL